MKISLRVFVLLVCAYLVAPLIGGFRWGIPALPLAISQLFIGVCALGIYAGHRWTRRALLIHAVLWTAMAMWVTLVTPAGLYGLLSIFLHDSSASRNGAEGAIAAKYLFWSLWVHAAWSWLLAVLVRRLARSKETPAVAMSRPEKRSLLVGIGLLCALLFVSPLVINVLAPIREIAPDIFLTDRKNVRVTLAPAQLQTLTGADQQVVDEINEDLTRILSNLQPLHLRAEAHSQSTLYISLSGRYYLVAYQTAGRVQQIDVNFYDSELDKVVRGRKFVVRE